MAGARTVRSWAAALACAVALSGCGIGAAGQRPLAAGTAPEASATASASASIPRVDEVNPAPDGIRAKGNSAPDEAVTPWDLPAGSLYQNPASGRREIIDPTVAQSVVLMGDSQSAGAAGVQGPNTWVQRALAAQGYKVQFFGAGGTGFVARTTLSPNYPDAVESGRALLPYGNPALVVVEGGGNDAGRGVTDAQILANATRLVKDLKSSYPASKFLLIGTLAKGAANGGGRRTQIDDLLAGFARSNGLAFIGPGDWVTRYGVAAKLADGVHLTAEGHQVLGGVLAGQLKALGLNGPPPKQTPSQPPR
ncbi:SGNH/GDSL hydrolase family protein [Pseudarthrobacter sp. P1]|uniref:SGNH/GDSL hydrolase family protein n=1 Tax=Pseudarthrobacter sp. P1 TaxID=3418418 RepID=UPI003CEBF7A7